MNVIDLFAGAGGLSEGFRQEGFNILAHVEMDSNACLTLKTREAYYYLVENNLLEEYKRYLLKEITREELYALVPNYVLDRVIESEISEATLPSIFATIDNIIEEKTIDFVIGGPPCQAYSTAGISRDPNRMKGDPRNYLYLYYIKFLKRYKPNYFIFENVRGILTAKNGEIFEDLQKQLDKAGYQIDKEILNSKDFGVAQSRQRVIIIGWKKELEFTYPEFKTKNTSPTISELFSDLPKLVAGQTIDGRNKYISAPNIAQVGIRQEKWDILTYHISRPNNKNDLEIYDLVVKTWDEERKALKYNELPERLITHKNSKSFLDRYKMIPSDSCSYTIVAHISKDGHYYIHPDRDQNRSISVREAARIQSFPDDFYFESSRTAAFQQIGNAVPPLMAKIIASHLKTQIKL